MEQIESADVSHIVDSSSRELLDELNRKRSKARLWPFVGIAAVVMFGFGVSLGWPAWVVGIFAIITATGTYAAYIRDALQKTVVLFYDFDTDMEAAYAKLHAAASQLANCTSAWHIEASGKVHDRKYHAGASDLVRRRSTSIRKEDPPYVKTNIETVAVGVGRQTLHFFPDRVLVYDQTGEVTRAFRLPR
ncbi:hypothetical protein [Chitinilyticum litopenaei]|uniref:hypothetical protein n=1 Tax=Chitinilyticum litopenaei TaxID=1121276 RepID=UPI001FE1A977|nr:hypothetical protein [Chitinilyticum litopenaei]